jgi:hypothetical protein
MNHKVYQKTTHAIKRELEEHSVEIICSRSLKQEQLTQISKPSRTKSNFIQETRVLKKNSEHKIV